MGGKWFEIWFGDKESVLETMVKNMVSDLSNGYDYFGKSITEQRKMIEDYRKKFNAELDRIQEMDEKKAERWCYIDLKRRGAIT